MFVVFVSAGHIVSIRCSDICGIGLTICDLGIGSVCISIAVSTVIAAIVAIEPGGTPAIGSEQYTKLLSAGIPIAIYFGDYIDNGPEDIMSTSFWRQVRDGALAFAAQYNADGGDCTVVDLPKIGITGNSHFMFQELNNKEIADHIYQWLESRALA